MISGRTVTVLTPTSSTTDRFGEPVPGTPTEQIVDNVLIVPGSSRNLDATRPDGVTVAFTLHFPKTYSGDLRGCSVVLDGEYAGEYQVVGMAYSYQKENCPPGLPWYMEVEVGVVYG